MELEPKLEPKLGQLQLCMDVKDLDASLAFYQSIGFRLKQRQDKSVTGWKNCAYLAQSGFVLFLIEDWGGKLPKPDGTAFETAFCFRGGDVPALAKSAEEAGAYVAGGVPDATDDGHGLAWLQDPEGRVFMLDTMEAEAAAWPDSSVRDLLQRADQEYLKD